MQPTLGFQILSAQNKAQQFAPTLAGHGPSFSTVLPSVLNLVGIGCVGVFLYEPARAVFSPLWIAVAILWVRRIQPNRGYWPTSVSHMARNGLRQAHVWAGPRPYGPLVHRVAWEAQGRANRLDMVSVSREGVGCCGVGALGGLGPVFGSPQPM